MVNVIRAISKEDGEGLSAVEDRSGKHVMYQTDFIHILNSLKFRLPRTLSPTGSSGIKVPKAKKYPMVIHFMKLLSHPDLLKFAILSDQPHLREVTSILEITKYQ